jgi:hypothetical protein
VQTGDLLSNKLLKHSAVSSSDASGGHLSNAFLQRLG